MTNHKNADLKPLADKDGEPAFDEPWQAEALGIADSLVQIGLFGASEWSDALGRALRRAEADHAADTQETYYRCVLAALEELVAEHGGIDREAMQRMRGDWEEAYRSTPHGQPVRLKRNQSV